MTVSIQRRLLSNGGVVYRVRYRLAGRGPVFLAGTYQTREEADLAREARALATRFAISLRQVKRIQRGESRRYV
jgi:hypothetical protein